MGLFNSNEIEKQVNHAKVLFGKWLQDGSSVWDTNNSTRQNTHVAMDSKVNSTLISVVDLDGYCVQWKREGKYAEAISGYLRSLSACYNKYGKLPIGTMRGLIKVFISANEFLAAFGYSSTALADLQHIPYADQNEKQLFMRYWSDLAQLSIQIIDYNSFDNLEQWCANFSGNPNYKMIKTNQEVKKQMLEIRNHYREVYGK